MTLTSGTKLGPYEILAPLGAGGMGEVYRARDTRLQRDVAIKILPEAFARDVDRLHRFEHEAHILSTLNHPNLLAIYDVGAQDGIHYLVSEYLEGLTLRERMSSAPSPQRKVTEYALQIANGLAAAHDKGIVHRDLKPENVFVTREERVKILDFGLAKQTQPSNLAAETAAMTSPNPTAAGMVLGTIGYMSPEQVKGQVADHRSDIFSFGAILYEMATGKRAFKGESSAETMSAILKEDPPEMAASGLHVSPGLERIVRRCLEKSVEQRFQSAKDLGFALESVTGSFVSAAAPAPTSRVSRRMRAGIAISALAALAVAAITWRRFMAPAASASPVTKRLSVSLPEAEPLGLTSVAPLGIGRTSIAISPDGLRIAYVGNRNGTPELLVRDIGQFESRVIPGTEGAFSPFFSPDGVWIGFFSGNKLEKVSRLGGEPVNICEARQPWGATWGADDSIVFANYDGNYLSQVPGSGGTPRVVAELGEGDGLLNGPSFLPDGKSVMFTVLLSDNPDYSRIEVLSLANRGRKILLEGGTNPLYDGGGHLLFLRGGTLFAVPFDLKSLKVTGAATPVVDRIRTERFGAGQIAVSNEGTLVYIEGNLMWKGELVWIDRQGTAKPAGVPLQIYGALRISPDGRRMAVAVGGTTGEIWVYDFGRAAFTRLTPEGYSGNPAWTADGKSVTYWVFRGGKTRIVSRAADGSGAEEPLWPGAGGPESWSPDGKMLALDCAATSPGIFGDICLLRKGDQKPEVFLATSATEWGAKFSPDGKWIAYTSDESGRYEVYVRPYPGPGGQWQISTEGGAEPVWAPDGRELFYANGYKTMAARVQTTPEFRAEAPRLLFERPTIRALGISNDIAPDGQHFLMIGGPEERKTTELKVVLNWIEELKVRAPVH